MHPETKNINLDMYYYTTSTLYIDPDTITTEVSPLNGETGLRRKGQTRPRRLTTAARIAALEQLILSKHDAPSLRRKDMARILGVGLSRIKDDLRLLAAQGKVVFVGPGSHSGHWHLNGDPETESAIALWLQTPGYHLLHASRGRYSDNQTAKKPTSTSKYNISTSNSTGKGNQMALRCLEAALVTPLALYVDIHPLKPPYLHYRPSLTSQLWQDALSPFRPPLFRG